MSFAQVSSMNLFRLLIFSRSMLTSVLLKFSDSSVRVLYLDAVKL